MNPLRSALRVIAAFAILVLADSLASAQATRTWVSGVGDDANPGSRTAPCKTFAGAISKTAAGGEIDCLDPGGFGAVTITKAITIDGGGTFASILVSGTNGIVVNAGPNDVVTIRNLSINGAGTGLSGVRFLAGSALHIENCSIFQFTTNGIGFEPAATSQLFVRDTVIRNINNSQSAPSGGNGILVKPTAAGTANVSVDGVRLDNNFVAIRAESLAGSTNPVLVTARNSVVSDSFDQGFIASAAGAAVVMDLQSCVASNNNAGANTKAIRSINPAATIRLSNVTVANNDTGLLSTNSGQILSFGNNRITGNTIANGAPTAAAIPQQ